MSHLCPGPGCHYPRYDIRPVGSESEPKFKARMGGSSRRRSRKRTPPRKSRKRTPQRKSRKRTPPKGQEHHNESRGHLEDLEESKQNLI